MGILKQTFYLLPDFVALVLAAIVAALVIWTEVPAYFARRPLMRGLAIAFCIALGIGAFVASQFQKTEDTAKRDELSGQIKILIHNSQTQATADEVTTVGTALGLGVQRLEDDIKAKGTTQSPAKVPQDIRQPSLPPETIRSTQKRVLSADTANPYGLEVIINSDTSFSPVGLKLTFSGPISKISFFLAGQPVTMMSQSFVTPENPAVAVVRVGYPAMGPDTPMVVNVLSKDNVKLISIEKIAGTVGAAY